MWLRTGCFVLVAALGCNRSDTAHDKAVANAQLEAHREIRYRSLAAELQVIDTQPIMINAIAQTFPLTAESRADVTDKLQKLQMRSDEAKKQVPGLESVGVDQLEDADGRARGALDKLRAACKEAWAAVRDARRTDRSS